MSLHPLALLSCLVGLAVACGPKLIRETVYDEAGVHVELRRSSGGESTLPGRHTQAVSIADVRIAHILASLTHTDGSGRRRATIRTEHVYPAAEGIGRALVQAQVGDEIAVATFPVDRRLRIFNDARVTTFRTWFDGDELVLEFFGIEDDLDKRAQGRSGYQIPVTAPSWKPGFTLVAVHAQRLVGPRTIRIDWRNPSYGRAINLRFRDGSPRRRTILMEAEPESRAAVAEPPTLDGPLADAQLRALDQLQAARRSGLLTEPEYRRRRRLVIEGRLEEAGYDAGQPD